MNKKVSRNGRRPAAKQDWVISRRVFLKSSAASLACLPLSCANWGTSHGRHGAVRFGIVTDCHYADADAAGTRFYRESLDKLTECEKLMNAEKVDFLIELGDFKDQDRPPAEQKTLSYLHATEQVFQEFNGPTYHVLGNHDLDSISKTQFLSRVENTNIESSRSYYSFDVNDLHCVVLDANYKTDGGDYDHGNFDWTDANIPPKELDWLRQDLDAAREHVIVFMHQLLDGTGSVYVKNAPDVRQILEASGKVLAVFQGHHHAGSYSNIAGIHYYTLKALVEGTGPENNSYAIAEVSPDGNVAITGYRRAISKRLEGSLEFRIENEKSATVKLELMSCC
ncbi:MAG: metallophosphoesterase [Planctomycetota bacterium]|jgi:predicted phosphodiesterase